jgi:hypothetical protein
MSYLLVAAGAGAGVVGAGALFVVFAEGVDGGVLLLSSLGEQPANTPKIPDSTIRVNSLFIVELSFDQFCRKDK